MASAGEDPFTQELSLIFKSLGQRGKEGELWKAHAENVSGYLLQQISELLRKSGDHIVLRPYGSAVEDLKSLETHDVGDLDIVIFPNSDNLLIHDEMIEYLPENPMHVRIKGVGHPVLHSYLVEDTDYVATLALKSFNPAIYGRSVPHVVDYLTRAIQVASREGWVKIYSMQWENNESSPALQLNYAQGFGQISGEVEISKDPQKLPNLDPAELESLAHAFCISGGNEYTKERAEILNEYVKFANELQMSMRQKGTLGLPQAFPAILQELVFSDRVKQLRALFLDSESRSQNGSRRREDCLADAAGHKELCVTWPEDCHEHESGRNKENASQGTLPFRVGSFFMPENADDNQRSSDELDVTSQQSTMGGSPENSDQCSENSMSKQVNEETVHENGNSEESRRRDPADSKTETDAEQKPLAQKGEVTYEDQQRNREGKNEDFKELSSRTNHIIEHLFGTTENEVPTKGTKFKDTQKERIVGGFDLVPAFRCRGWPKVAREWIKRVRKWPPPGTVDKVVQEGFHLVVKPPKKGGNTECDFRLSFSNAEYLLSQEMNDIQRECYRCLKKFHRAYLSVEPKSLVTFHLKNILLQTIEETGAEMWIESNRTKCMMKLFKNLLEALTKKDLRHFFVRSYNLFSVDYIENPEILESLAGIVEQIMENPMQFATKLTQNEEDANQVKKEECVTCSEPTTKSASEQSHDKMDENPTKDSYERQSKHEPLTIPVEKGAASQGNSSNTSYRYHDLKDIYLATSKELTDLAFNGHSLESVDTMERSLVDDLREMIAIHNLQVEEFHKMFEGFWDIVFWKVWLSPEPNTKRRMLETIQGVIETWKYLTKQDDFAPENIEAMCERMFDPDVDNPFDWSRLLPAGIGTQLISKLINNFEQRPAPTQHVGMEDIPLD